MKLQIFLLAKYQSKFRCLLKSDANFDIHWLKFAKNCQKRQPYFSIHSFTLQHLNLTKELSWKVKIDSAKLLSAKWNSPRQFRVWQLHGLPQSTRPPMQKIVNPKWTSSALTFNYFSNLKIQSFCALHQIKSAYKWRFIFLLFQIKTAVHHSVVNLTENGYRVMNGKVITVRGAESKTRKLKKLTTNLITIINQNLNQYGITIMATCGVSLAFFITLRHIRSIVWYRLLSTGSCRFISSELNIGSR